VQLNVRYELLFCRMQLWVRPVCAIQWRWFDPVRQDNFRFARHPEPENGGPSGVTDRCDFPDIRDCKIPMKRNLGNA